MNPPSRIERKTHNFVSHPNCTRFHSVEEKAHIIESVRVARTARERAEVLHAAGITRVQLRAWQRAINRNQSLAHHPNSVAKQDEKSRLIALLRAQVEDLAREHHKIEAQIAEQKRAQLAMLRETTTPQQKLRTELARLVLAFESRVPLYRACHVLGISRATLYRHMHSLCD